MTKNRASSQPKEVHTELKPRDAEKARAAEAKRKMLDPLPDPISDDALDDLFNDMPV